MVFELIFTVHKGNKTLGVTHFFFPTLFPSAKQTLRESGPESDLIPLDLITIKIQIKDDLMIKFLLDDWNPQLHIVNYICIRYSHNLL
jgi:hypothetical protein